MAKNFSFLVLSFSFYCLSFSFLFLSLLCLVSLVCTFALLNCKSFIFIVFYYSVKHFKLRQCMKCAVQIKLPCLAYGQDVIAPSTNEQPPSSVLHELNKFN